MRERERVGATVGEGGMEEGRKTKYQVGVGERKRGRMKFLYRGASVSPTINPTNTCRIHLHILKVFQACGRCEEIQQSNNLKIEGRGKSRDVTLTSILQFKSSTPHA